MINKQRCGKPTVAPSNPNPSGGATRGPAEFDGRKNTQVTGSILPPPVQRPSQVIVYEK